MAKLSTVSKKGQTTIPQEIRESLDLHEGDHVVFEIADNGRVVLRKVRAQDEDRDQRPADEHGRRAGPGQAVVEQDDRTGQDADDAEADGEVAEPAHGAEELLGIAQAVQFGDVLLDRLFA